MVENYFFLAKENRNNMKFSFPQKLRFITMKIIENYHQPN